ncbi:MAG: vWA domain-containing protein [Brevinematia bacterium]
MQKLLLLLVISLLLIANLAFSTTYIIVIDTSLSMNRRVIDNTRLFDIALKSLSNSLYSLKKGDIVYIVDFNEKVNIRPPIKIKDENTKEVIYKVMVGLQPYGKWTFTYQMLEEISILIKSNNINPVDSKVIIISDGIDDPPVKSKKYFVNLEKISTLFDPKQLIYYISLEKLSQNKTKKTELSEKLKSTSQIVVVEVENTNQLTQSIEKSFKSDRIPLLYILIGTLTITLLLIWLILNYIYIPSVARKNSGINKLICSSEKSKKTILLKGPKIIITPNKGRISLQNWTYNGKLTLKATMKGYKLFYSNPSGVFGISNGNILTKESSFSITNYTFKTE